MKTKDSDRRQSHEASGRAVDAATDPVCGMSVPGSTRRLDHGGKTFVFCSDSCLNRFQKDPERFLTKES